MGWVRVAAVAVLGWGAVARAAADVPEPRLGLFVERADIERGRARAGREAWAREYRAAVINVADQWVARPDEWIRGIVPKPGDRFAYGIAGCPKCGKGWPNFARGVASFERPGVLACTHCRAEFDVTRQGGEFADTGTGVVVNGRRHWLRATWNGFVAEQMWSAFTPDASAVTALGEAYALTGDERYAKKLVTVMDALATLAPHTRGPRDFGPDPDKDTGRLQHLSSIVYRAQVHFARALDLVGRRAELRAESKTRPGVSVWENVREGIFEEYLFKEFDNRNGRLYTLHNHEADSVRSVLLVGLLYGKADYVRWGAAGIRAFFDNTIDRDGLYYETSLSYTDFTRGVFVDMAEMLARYDPAEYPAEARMPQREDLPYGGNFFNHTKLARLVLDQPARVSILGRKPTFGNNHWDTTVWRNEGRAFDRPGLMQAQRFALYATDDGIRAKARRVLEAMAPMAGQRPLGGWWQLYRSPDVKVETGAKGVVPEELASDFFGQAGLVYLRGGRGATRRGAVMRVGVNLPHAHDDAGGLLLFAHGRALSGDLGYGIFGNHVHLGWANRAIAHNTVVVDEDASVAGRLFRMGPGGTITRFHEAPAAGVRWAEADMSRAFEPEDGVSDYRRLVVQVDVGPDASYWVDLFDVVGGRVHDYSFHAPPLGRAGEFAVSGLEPKAVDGVWTLAGLSPKYRDAAFDQEGRSWGERVGATGMITKLPGVEDGVPERGAWYAPPGNGYGFLYGVKVAEAREKWSTRWDWKGNREEYGLKLTMLPEGGQRVMTAWGPTLRGDDRMNWVVARTTGGTSRFAAVIESPGGGAGAALVDAILDGGKVVGVVVRGDGWEDRVIDARRGPVDAGGVRLDSGLAVVRQRGGEVVSVTVSGATSLEVGGFAVRAAAARVVSRVTAVDLERNTFRVMPPLPRSVAGGVITVDGAAYAHGSAYRVESVSADGNVRPLNSELTLARARVESVAGNGIVSTSPLVYGYEYDRDTRFLTGKRVSSGAESGRVAGMAGFREVRVRGFSPSPGEEFVVQDVQAGDEVAAETTVSVTCGADREWVVQGNLPADVTFPFGVETRENSAWTPVTPGDAVRATGGELRVRAVGVKTRPPSPEPVPPAPGPREPRDPRLDSPVSHMIAAPAARAPRPRRGR